jgi:hypothetical protein
MDENHDINVFSIENNPEVKFVSNSELELEEVKLELEEVKFVSNSELELEEVKLETEVKPKKPRQRRNIDGNKSRDERKLTKLQSNANNRRNEIEKRRNFDESNLENLDKLTIYQLKTICSEYNIKGISKLNKDDLIKRIEKEKRMEEEQKRMEEQKKQIEEERKKIEEERKKIEEERERIEEERETNYIYLIIEREFRKTRENIFKVGMTKQKNDKRFKQYPKDSKLLFQMICKDCKNIEKQIIKLFKEKFKHRNDIGNEYFEGDYKIMIDTIYLTLKNEENI